jgi:aminobenzoyl-glutamate transport protein
MLSGLSTEAAHIVDPNYDVLPTAYYYFMVVSTFMITIVCTFVTAKWVEPRLGKYSGEVEREEIAQPTDLEKKGLFRVGLVALGFTALMLIVLVPENGLLRCVDGSLLNSPALRGIITLLFLVAAAMGIVYGYAVGTFAKADDVINAMGDSMKTVASYLVLAFFMAQFVAWFDWSNLGMLLAISGASVLQDANIGLIPLIVIFITITAFLNLFIGSASAKWAILAPIFIPIFMLSGYSPELAQTAYSIGDGATNIITPLMPYFALIIVFCQKYDKDAGIGTIIATMMPYSIAIFISWTLLLIGWILLKLPLGPGSPLYYVMTEGVVVP